MAQPGSPVVFSKSVSRDSASQGASGLPAATSMAMTGGIVSSALPREYLSCFDDERTALLRTIDGLEQKLRASMGNRRHGEQQVAEARKAHSAQHARLAKALKAAEQKCEEHKRAADEERLARKDAERREAACRQKLASLRAEHRGQLEGLRGKMDVLNERCSAMACELASARRTAAEAGDAIAAAEERAIRARAAAATSVERAKARADVLEEKLRNDDDRVRLQAQLHEATQKIRAMRSSGAEAEEEFARAQARLQAELQDANNKAESSAGEAKLLRTNLQQARADRHEADTARDRAISEAERLRCDLDRARQAFNSASAEAGATEKELLSRAADAEAERDEWHRRFLEAAARADASEIEKSSLQVSFEHEQRSVEELSARLEELEAKNAELLAALSAEKEMSAALTSEVHEKEHENSRLREAATAATQQKDDLLQDSERIRCRVHKLERELADANDACIRAAADSDATALRRALDESQRRVQMLQAELSAVQDGISPLHNAATALKRQRDELVGVVEAMAATHAEQASLLSDLQRDRAEQAASASEHVKHVEQLRRALRSVEAERDEQVVVIERLARERAIAPRRSAGALPVSAAPLTPSLSPHVGDTPVQSTPQVRMNLGAAIGSADAAAAPPSASSRWTIVQLPVPVNQLGISTLASPPRDG